MKKINRYPIVIVFVGMIIILLACAMPSKTSEPQIIVVTSEPSVTPKQSIIDVSGSWNCTNGRKYEFTQNGNRFAWDLESLNEKGNGVIIGNNAAVSWAGDGGIGSAICQILSDSEIRATRIDCDNGVSFIR